MKRIRRPATRPTEILAAAIKLAHRHGYATLSREQIADAARCSPATVSHVFGTMPQMRRAIMGEAIRLRDAKIVAQGIAIRDSRALKADESLRRAAAESIYHDQ